MEFTFDPLKHKYTLNGKPMTGCTTILNVIAKPALIQWAANEAIEYIKKSLSETDFRTRIGDLRISVSNLEGILEEARTAHARKRDKAADDGTNLHAEVEAWIKRCIRDHSGLPVDAPETLKPLADWALSKGVRFLDSETRFYSESLWVAGTADLLFEMEGKRYIGDIKVKKKIWSREPFFQMAGYAIMAEEMGEIPFDGYCILRLKDGFEDMWSFDVEGDKAAFRAAVTLYRQLANFK